MPPSFTIGIEEEYLLVDPATRDVVSDPPEAMLSACEAALPGRLTPEFMRCQVEVTTPVCASVAEARSEITRLRTTVRDIVKGYGFAPVAVSTHPFAVWGPQRYTDKERYAQLARDLGMSARRLLISGMHVHVGIEQDDLRIDLMNQARYFLPHLLALSTSSPFWQGENSDLKSYRLSVWDELPRTGIPEEFGSFGEYERCVNALVRTGVIEDTTKIWWDLRPSHRFPTLEMRITDICTRLDDCICIAALYVCILRMLYRLRTSNVRWRTYKSLLISENRWRAQRYGYDEGLIDFGKTEMVPYRDLLEELIALVREDAEALGCVADIEHARRIVNTGTSAHRQLEIYHTVRAEGGTEDDALKAVVDWLMTETVEGL